MTILPFSLTTKFSTSTLSGQFILCKSDQLVPDAWDRRESGSWILGNHTRLPVVSFGNATTGIHGWLIGHAIDPLAGKFVFGADLPPEIPSLVSFNEIESWFNTLTGRFAAVVFSSTSSRVYLDASGSLSSVWHAESCICASSPMLIPYNAETEDNEELISALRIPESNMFFAFGLTPRHNIHRILPNHYLDLNTWQTVRHWPRDPILPIHPSEGINAISQLLTGAIRAVCEQGDPYMSLTAGRDSRMLLGCAKSVLDRIQFFTWQLPDSSATVDIRVAKAIAKHYRLRYKILPFSEATMDDKEEWLYRTGCAVGEVRGRSLTTTIKSMDKQRFYLPGLASGVGRCIYWVTGDIGQPSLTAEQIVARLKLPPLKVIIDRAHRWNTSLVFETRCEQLDFLLLEQRLGCWAGVTAYGHADGPIRVAPFSNRAIYTLMLGLPYEYRMSETLTNDLLESVWPELQTVSPFNPGITGIRKFFGSRLAKLPFLWRLARKL